MKEFNNYQLSYGQQINKGKTTFYTYGCSDKKSRRRLRRWAGFKEVEFPFTYLGCPVYLGKKLVAYFADMATKVLKKAAGWQSNMLSARGRAIIIKHILQSQSLYTMAALVPPKTIMDQIEMYLANFFCDTKEGTNKYHRSSWDNMCYPFEEGGLGFMKIHDINNAFNAKG
ncbi:hypothetical protein R3W88_004432 [Solanum pinnatisectum]|uniref:Uncharacterized protein n=1 Tax=Solanum pinnatisectum TaxID=50273 RepID=A0AAV9K9C3_9SOLN|nr:hypothetical protein R3W88_004432 [Solanum pinnatisectum]